MLIIEFKPETAKVPREADAAAPQVPDVWVMYGEGPVVDIDWGDGKTRLSLEEVADEVVLWFEEAGNDAG